MYLVVHGTDPQLRTDLNDDDVVEFVLGERRDRPDGRPWVSCNMVTSLDGAATVDGLSGALGGEGDKLLFSTLRATADVIIAGSATVIEEQYRLPRVPEGARGEWRAATGRTARPRLCIVTTKGGVPQATRLLDELPSSSNDPELRPIIATTDDAPSTDGRFDVLRCGADRVDPRILVDQLGVLGLETVLCEGGPSLLGQFAAADLIDEWNFTLAAAIVSGDSKRPVHGAPEHALSVALDRTVVHDDGTLFLRYVRPGIDAETAAGTAEL